MNVVDALAELRCYSCRQWHSDERRCDYDETTLAAWSGLADCGCAELCRQRRQKKAGVAGSVVSVDTEKNQITSDTTTKKVPGEKKTLDVAKEVKITIGDTKDPKLGDLMAGMRVRCETSADGKTVTAVQSAAKNEERQVTRPGFRFRAVPTDSGRLVRFGYAPNCGPRTSEPRFDRPPDSSQYRRVAPVRAG